MKNKRLLFTTVGFFIGSLCASLVSPHIGLAYVGIIEALFKAAFVTLGSVALLKMFKIF